MRSGGANLHLPHKIIHIVCLTFIEICYHTEVGRTFSHSHHWSVNVSPFMDLFVQLWAIETSVAIKHKRLTFYIITVMLHGHILHGHMTSPIGRSALYCGLRFKFDIGRLLDPRFDCCNLVWNNYLSNVSAELLANVSVLKDFLLLRDKPELCSDVFNTDDITCFITALCTG